MLIDSEKLMYSKMVQTDAHKDFVQKYKDGVAAQIFTLDASTTEGLSKIASLQSEVKGVERFFSLVQDYSVTLDFEEQKEKVADILAQRLKDKDDKMKATISEL